jgi:23S rRNA pseudouridine2605 synthase
MRLNRFVALATGLSRRAADKLADEGELSVNGTPVRPGHEVTEADHVTWRNKTLQARPPQTVVLHKPAGYVCSRKGQGSKTVYDLLPPELHHLKPIGRLDKNSSGLLLLTNDGKLAEQLTHPKFHKPKTYFVTLDKPLTLEDRTKIAQGVRVQNYISRLQLTKIKDDPTLKTVSEVWQIVMKQGKNRQIRRTFERLGYRVQTLHRTTFGDHQLKNLAPRSWYILEKT